MNSSYDVLIAGAGIVGAACAFELAKAKMRVAIVDRSFPASGATGASMGHIVAMDDSEAQFALTRYSQVLWHELRDALPGTIEFDNCGTIWLASDDDELDEARRKHHYYGERGVDTEILDSSAVHDAEPNLKTPMAGGLLVESDAVVYPPAATAFFLEQAAALGATVILDRAVRTLGNSRARMDDGTVLSAAKLVNATGCRAPELTEGIQVKPRKGHLVITDRLSRCDSPPTRGARLSEIGALGHRRLGRVQLAAAKNRASPHRLIAPVWRSGRARRLQPCVAYARSRVRIRAEARFPVRHSSLDRVPPRHSRQLASDWTLGERSERVTRYRTRRPRDNHIARDCETRSRAHRRVRTGDSFGAIPSIASHPCGNPCVATRQLPG